ncbi:hypothetical protein [Peribacillus loiseleuriae]|uniref:Uncharacterized protein n=1 Tax=Peribacillus loiseleuriae TaxID=1679170 RepID=A0A0K9GZ26_9BACI|nr:hypothetical protein [Peribacillus loiseleuriae]KMY51492.1 hypothetical protein AC625_19710 [Peribacillus loiseleuriae]
MNKNKTVKQHLITGCILLGILIIMGSIQVVFSPLTFVRSIMLIAVIGCSAGVGSFIRELFVLKKNKIFK